MLVLEVNGIALDLRAGTKIAYQWKSPCNGFDSLSLSRTQSFSLPVTEQNLTLLGYPTRPDMYGGAVRAIQQSRLTTDANQIDGTLIITDVTPKDITVSFVYGEMSKLKEINEAGKISQFLSVPASDMIVIREGYWYYEASRVLNSPYYETGRNKNYSIPCRLPSVSMNYLISLCASHFGVNIDASVTAGNYRIVPGTLNASSSTIYSGAFSMTSAHYNLPSTLSACFQEEMIYVRNTVNNTTAPFYALKCLQPGRFFVTGSNPQPYVNNRNDFLFWGVIRKASVQPTKTYDVAECFNGENQIWTYYGTLNNVINLEAGDYIYFANFYNMKIPGTINRYGSGIRSYTGSIGWNCTFFGAGGSLELTQDSYGPLMGSYFLRDNLPEISFSQILKTCADLQAKVLTWNESSQEFSLFDMDFDSAGGDVINLDKRLIKINKIKRQTFEGARELSVSLAKCEEDGWDYNEYSEECRSTKYYTNNDTLENKERVICDGELVACPTKYQKTGVSQHYAYIPCAEYDNDLGIWGAKTIDKPVICEQGTKLDGIPDLAYLYPATVKHNVFLDNICQLSTQVEIEVIMSSVEFFRKITAVSRFTFRGCWWFALECNYAEGKATILLQRYK